MLRCDYVCFVSECTKQDETEIKKGHVFCLKYDKKLALNVVTKSQLVASVLVDSLPFFLIRKSFILHYISCR